MAGVVARDDLDLRLRLEERPLDAVAAGCGVAAAWADRAPPSPCTSVDRADSEP